MNKLIRLSKTGIDYGDYAWNFASGCGNQAEGKCNAGGFNCWAHSICKRFEGHYPNGFEPHIYPEALLSPLYLRKPSRILCAFMGDLFWDCPEFDPSHGRGEYGEDEAGYFTLKGRIFDTIEKCPQHQFLFLTKQSQNLIKWSPFPDNAWVGVSATTELMFQEAAEFLLSVKAPIKYLSIEPLLEWGSKDFLYSTEELLKAANINQVIIGAQSKPTVYPRIEWVREIVQAADKAGVKVFLKDNLKPLLPVGLPFYRAKPLPHIGGHYSEWEWELRQEMPTPEGTNAVSLISQG